MDNTTINADKPCPEPELHTQEESGKKKLKTLTAAEREKLPSNSVRVCAPVLPPAPPHLTPSASLGRRCHRLGPSLSAPDGDGDGRHVRATDPGAGTRRILSPPRGQRAAAAGGGGEAAAPVLAPGRLGLAQLPDVPRSGRQHGNARSRRSPASTLFF